MTLLPQHSPPFEEVWVALDLETTGLSPKKDRIIEIGAVKFQGHEVLDTFQSFVNPGRRLSPFIRQFTGITQAQVNEAPPFSSVAGQFATFIGSSPVVGHNLGFDLGFLEAEGLKLSNPRCDTWDLTFVMRPGLPEYSLSRLASRMSLQHDRPHRAVDDALATKEVFVTMVEEASRLDLYTIAEMSRLAERSSWVLGYVLKGLESQKGSWDHGAAAAQDVGTGAAGVDLKEIASRLHQRRSLRATKEPVSLDLDVIASMLRSGGPFSRSIPAFEERTEQVEMALAVGRAINEGQRLIVEAGTGVGKSLAYLLPAALYALMNDKRVVISTNTINLQEQLANKDLPDLVSALRYMDTVDADELSFTQLKGRANYLCLRRFGHMRSSDPLADNEARLLAKAMVWLKDTSTGDRSEINLGNRNSAAPWERLSAQGAFECLSTGGPCFLRAARERAAASHIVVVNHALLLSDVIAGGTLIPDYDILIVDEAHHLEDEATRHFGFELAQGRFDEFLTSLSGDRGLLNEAVAAFRTASGLLERRESAQAVATNVSEHLPRLRDSLAQMYAAIKVVLDESATEGTGQVQELRVTNGVRSQPAWSEAEIAWQNVDILLSELGSSLKRLYGGLDDLANANLLNYDGLMMELVNAQQTNAELRQRLTEFVPHPEPEGIYWVTNSSRSGDIALHMAPLHVGNTLEESLFSLKESVIMTSATLSAKGSFSHMVERTGFSDAEELLLGSPFDYPRAALVCVPQDMPEPNSWAYQGALEQAVVDAADAAEGRTMALFTSHASLQATAKAIRSQLQAKGIRVMAQGLDGSPAQLLRRFLDDPKAVLLGTSSFWEGVDLAGDVLKVLLVSRLPFSVPTDPVFAARSELYESSFNQYAVPQAILRLRQGFGRLIRTKTDRGVAIILDKRISSRGYGKAFLSSLPETAYADCALQDLKNVVGDWLTVTSTVR